MSRILTYPNELLREPTKFVPDEMLGTQAVADIVSEMHDVLKTEDNGAALAANQIGLPWRIFVTKEDWGRGQYFKYFINPVWESGSGTKSIETESCLSFPGMSAAVARYVKIKLKFRDILGFTRQIDLRGFNARVVQHECDHLDGKLFIDRADPKLRDEIISAMAEAKE